MWRQEGEESVLQPDDWMEGEIRNLSFWFSVRIRVNRAMERTRQISHCGTKTLHELQVFSLQLILSNCVNQGDQYDVVGVTAISNHSTTELLRPH